MDDGKPLEIAVLGTGHVGLVTCVSLSALGHSVVGYDSDPEKLELLRKGVAPFFEPQVEELLQDCLRSKKLTFARDIGEAVTGSQVVFICVGTPARASGEANLLAVERVASQVARHATPGTVVVEKSTVPTGTAKRVHRILLRARPELQGKIDVVSNPEFLREGSAVADALEPDRILVGASSSHAFEVMRQVYRPLLDKGCRLIETDIASAELAKHACNAFLALKISFANALARICERAGADVLDVVEVMGSDRRIGRPFLNAGLGYGGYCFPKDLVAFERLAARLGYDFTLLKQVARINEEAIEAAFEKILDAVWNLEDKRIALLGLSFKPGTDDIRFSPALALARKLIAEGAAVVGYDPEAMSGAKAELPELELAATAYEAARGADCVVLCTEWADFLSLDLLELKSLMAYPVLIDGRNVFEPEEMESLGFTYVPMGRPGIV